MTHQPIGFARAGSICSAEKGFMEQLAEAFDAELCDPKSALRALTGKNISEDPSLRSQSRQAAVDKLKVSLSRGVNAVYSSQLNSESYRNRFRTTVAEAGGQTLILCVETPIAIIEQRLRDRHDTEAQAGRWYESFEENLDTARRIISNIEWPYMEPDVLRLNGAESNEELVARVQNHVAINGLLQVASK